MNRKHVAKVHLLHLKPPPLRSLLESPQQQVESALQRGNAIERYGRRWVVGGTAVRGPTLTGRIGVVGEEGTADVWDATAEDFKPVAYPAGLAAPFAANLSSFRLAIQPRPPHLRLEGAMGAIGALLKEQDEGWRVVADAEPMSLDHWMESVQRITSISFQLRKPNPHYQDTEDLEAVMENARAELVQLKLASDSGLDAHSPFVAQSQRHVDSEYGDSRYVGITKGTGQTSIYQSALGAEERPVEMEVGEDGEVPQSALVRLVSAGTSGDETDNHIGGMEEK